MKKRLEVGANLKKRNIENIKSKKRFFVEKLSAISRENKSQISLRSQASLYKTNFLSAESSKMKQGKEPRKTISDFGDSGLFRNSSHNNLGLKQSTVIASKRFSNNFEEKTRRLQKNRSFVEINVKTAKKTNKANGGAEKRQGQLSNALTIKKGSRSCLEIKEESIEGDDLESLIPDTPTHDKSNYSKSTVDSESGLNPLRDCFLEKDLMDLNTAELEEKFDLYSLNLERIEVI